MGDVFLNLCRVCMSVSVRVDGRKRSFFLVLCCCSHPPYSFPTTSTKVRHHSSTALASFQILNLQSNEFGSIGSKHIAELTTLTKLLSVHLARNQLCSEGVAYLTASPTLRNLLELNLVDNQIDCTGAESIAESTPIAKSNNIISIQQPH